MLEVIPKAMNAKAALGRMEIRAPYTGRVVALSVFSVGGVIQRGEKILDIVPDQDSHHRGADRGRGHQRHSPGYAR
jgi:Multidrug resistance efflux pump